MFNTPAGWNQDEYDRHLNGPTPPEDDTDEYLWYPVLACGHDSDAFIHTVDGEYLCPDCAALCNLPNMS